MNGPGAYYRAFIPSWFVNLHYEGSPDVASSYQEYLSYRDEGYSKDYILVRVLGLQDPDYDEDE